MVSLSARIASVFFCLKGYSVRPAPGLAVHRRSLIPVRAPRSTGRMPEVLMKTPGEIEAAISDGITRFEQEYMGRGPKHIHTYLLGDLLVVRLQGVLTAAEQQLVR